MGIAYDPPPLVETWDRYGPQTSRLTSGRLVPEPDYVVCLTGTNDFNCDLSDNYVAFSPPCARPVQMPNSLVS